MAIQVSEEFWADAEWAREHYGELQKQYKNMWVAVVGKMVVSYGKSLKEVESKAEKLTGRKDIFTMYIESGAAIY
jgi:hypothetical protein